MRSGVYFLDKKMKIILGSQSSSRKMILDNAGLKYQSLVADIDERAITSENPRELPILIARAKAKALLEQNLEPALLITADLVALFHDEIRGKPSSALQARQYLSSYSNSYVEAVSAVVVTNTKTNKQASGTRTTTAYFREIPSDAIEALIEDGKIFSAAGAFRVEDPLLSPYVKEMVGELDTIQGLSMELLRTLMEEVGG